MINEKDFEKLIADNSATDPAYKYVYQKQAAEKVFELAKQMRDDTSKDFAIWLGKNRWMYADVMNGEHEYYNEVTGKYVALSKLFSKYSGTPASSLAQEAEGKWISVKDRLPEDFWEQNERRKDFPHISGQQIIWNGCGVGAAAYDRNKKEWFIGGLTKDLGYTVVELVTHWQPLPSPPSSNKIN